MKKTHALPIFNVFTADFCLDGNYPNGPRLKIMAFLHASSPQKRHNFNQQRQN